VKALHFCSSRPSKTYWDRRLRGRQPISQAPACSHLEQNEMDQARAAANLDDDGLCYN
jgi:hypothetical protein